MARPALGTTYPCRSNTLFQSIQKGIYSNLELVSYISDAGDASTLTSDCRTPSTRSRSSNVSNAVRGESWKPAGAEAVGGVGSGASSYLESLGLSIEGRVSPSGTLFEAEGLFGIASDILRRKPCWSLEVGILLCDKAERVQQAWPTCLDIEKTVNKGGCRRVCARKGK